MEPPGAAVGAARVDDRAPAQDPPPDRRPSRRGGVWNEKGTVATDRVQVKPGDSLWSIAAEVLGTDDPGRIARYWPRIHRANRQIIGANPNLIFPGQVLELPAEEPRT
jgi:nucleoid-associated protein YgaU